MNRAVNLKVVSLILVLLFWAALLPEPALSEESFFKGKTVRIVVGYPPGGGFDTFSRILARHLPRYLPGKPSTIVQNKLLKGLLYCYEGTYITGERVVNYPSMQLNDALIEPYERLRTSYCEGSLFDV